MRPTKNDAAPVSLTMLFGDDAAKPTLTVPMIIKTLFRVGEN